LKIAQLFKYADDEVLVVKESNIMQACILVQVPRGNKVIKTFFLSHYLLEEIEVAFLDNALNVSHLSIA